MVKGILTKIFNRPTWITAKKFTFVPDRASDISNYRVATGRGIVYEYQYTINITIRRQSLDITEQKEKMKANSAWVEIWQYKLFKMWHLYKKNPSTPAKKYIEKCTD